MWLFLFICVFGFISELVPIQLTSPWSFTLQVFHVLKLGLGQDITSLALNMDNTNLLVSTVDKQLIIFTDPAVSQKLVCLV